MQQVCRQHQNNIMTRRNISIKYFFLIVLFLFPILSHSSIILNSAANTILFQDPLNSALNCFLINSKGICQVCSFGYILKNNACQVGETNCKTFDPLNGGCASCYVGYLLINQSKCEVNPKAFLNQGCHKLVGNSCIQCSSGYYFNYNGICELIDTLCKTFDFSTKVCIECYKGYSYQINRRQCIYNGTNLNSNCIQWQENNCLHCNTGYILQGTSCTIANPNCKQNTDDACSECFTGFILVNNTCIYNPSFFNNILCAVYDQHNKCLSCAYKSFMNSYNQCIPVNPLCLNYSIIDGSCTSCYGGYLLINGVCIGSLQYVNDPFCVLWQNDNCLTCAPWFYFNSEHKCKMVDPICKTYDQLTGFCSNCYDGYALIGHLCQSQPEQYCKIFQDGQCIQCYGGYFLSFVTDRCQLADILCKTVDGQGDCLTCYDGYTLNDGNCLIKNANCFSLNNDGTCIGCFEGYYMNMNGLCSLNSLNCVKYVQLQYTCQKCEAAFTLIDGVCYFTMKNQNASIYYFDPNCAQWSQNGQTCLTCAPHTYFNSKGFCQKISQFCLTYSQYNGQCLTCYQGYIISGTTCQLMVTNCLKVSQNGTCQSCYSSYYLQNGQCKLVDSLCASFNYTSIRCQNCYGGYTLINNTCIISK